MMPTRPAFFGARPDRYGVIRPAAADTLIARAFDIQGDVRPKKLADLRAFVAHIDLALDEHEAIGDAAHEAAEAALEGRDNGRFCQKRAETRRSDLAFLCLSAVRESFVARIEAATKK